MSTTPSSSFDPHPGRFSIEKLLEWIGRLIYTLFALPVALCAVVPVSVALAADRLVALVRGVPAHEAKAGPSRADTPGGVDCRAA